MEFSYRLRQLCEGNGWTVADMAERTGIPKRTLDKYMLRTGASVPGFDALVEMSKGLGISLDYLVFGAEQTSQRDALLAYKAADTAIRNFLENLYRHNEVGTEIFGDNTILTQPIELVSSTVASLAQKAAEDMNQRGITTEELLRWEVLHKERLTELSNDALAKFLEAV